MINKRTKALPGAQVQYVALRLEHALDDGSARLLADTLGKFEMIGHCYFNQSI